MDLQINNYNSTNNDFILFQSLPSCLRNLDRSLSFDFEGNMDNYMPSTSTFVDNVFHHPRSLNMDIQENNSINESAFPLGASNQYNAIALQEGIWRVRSLSFSCDTSMTSEDIDDVIFGKFPNYAPLGYVESSLSSVRSMYFSCDRNLSSEDIDGSRIRTFSSSTDSRSRFKSCIETTLQEGRKAPSVTISYEESMSSTEIDEIIFGKFSEPSLSLSERDASTVLHSSNEISAETEPLRRTSSRTLSNSSVEEDDCGYCNSIGLEYHGHSKKQCLQLSMLFPCDNCGASGVDNHTKIHCPYAAKEILQLKPQVRACLDFKIRMRALQREEQPIRLHYA